MFGAYSRYIAYCNTSMTAVYRWFGADAAEQMKLVLVPRRCCEVSRADWNPEHESVCAYAEHRGDGNRDGVYWYLL